MGAKDSASGDASARGPNSVASASTNPDSGQSSVNLRATHLMTESDSVVEEIDMDRAFCLAAARHGG
eukprot:4488581-Pyramimonas_sp.AAC.1